jgi:hypothetical protein
MPPPNWLARLPVTMESVRVAAERGVVPETNTPAPW